LRPRLPALTGLRFVAASMVFVLHSLPDPGRWISLDQGVSFFFVLSGFILTWVYPELPDRDSIKRFYIARLARLWPLHLATALLAIGIGGIGSVEPALLNPLLLHAWVPVRRIYFSYNAVSWSLSTEALFCLAFPLLVRSLRRTWWAKLAAAALLVAALITICNRFALPLFSQDGISAHGLLYISPMSRMLEFIAGMCCCILWRSLRRDIDGGVMAFTLAEILAVALAATLLIWPFPFAHAGVGPAGTLWMVRTSAMPGFCAIVAVFAFGRGLLSRLTGSRPFELLGEISFAIYLVHLLTIGAWARLVVPVAQWGFGDFAAVAISTLLAAAALHLMIERPCRSFVVRLGRLDPAGPYTPGARRQ
jgi:peptidoglycan/LPS O-acetylase OafA/YrhL